LRSRSPFAYTSSPPLQTRFRPRPDPGNLNLPCQHKRGLWKVRWRADRNGTPKAASALPHFSHILDASFSGPTGSAVAFSPASSSLRGAPCFSFRATGRTSCEGAGAVPCETDVDASKIMLRTIALIRNLANIRFARCMTRESTTPPAERCVPAPFHGQFFRSFPLGLVWAQSAPWHSPRMCF